MQTSKAVQPEQKKPQTKGLVLTPDEKKRLVDFFSLLIEIDQQNKKNTGVDGNEK